MQDRFGQVMIQNLRVHKYCTVLDVEFVVTATLYLVILEGLGTSK